MTYTRISLTVLSSIGAFVLPVFAFAQSAPQGQSIDKLGAFLQQFIGFIDNYLVPLIFAIAFIVFIFGIFQYFILGGADEEKRTKGRSLMVWGMIGFFVMVSIWGILNLFVNSLGFGSDSRPNLPTFGSPSSVQTQSPGATLPAAGVNKCANTVCAVGTSCNPSTGVCQ